MKVLVIGGGGREHAIVWALSRSPIEPILFTAPGNPGTARLGANVPISVNEINAAIRFAKDEEIDLTIIGPEVPLVNGWTDAFEAAGLRVFGPTAAAAEIEGSKMFAKAFMKRHGIPTARYESFRAEQFEQAKAYIDQRGAPVVLKADGLAAGKGVLICMNEAEAYAGLRELMVDRHFGKAGASVVIEEFMQGEEVSVFVLTDGERYVTLAPAQDHKRIGEGDTGLNTGGMGAYAPAPIATNALMDRIRSEIIDPTLRGMAAEDRVYRGILYVGLMITSDGPRVVEYNCRFGDPETQAILPLLQDDLLSLMISLLDGREVPRLAATKKGAAACVILASRGYPEAYEKGFLIDGLEHAEKEEDVVVFHAGTALGSKGAIVTNGGRVLGVTALGNDLSDALRKAYRGVDRIHFEGKQFRRDIGQKGLKRLGL